MYSHKLNNRFFRQSFISQKFCVRYKNIFLPCTVIHTFSNTEIMYFYQFNIFYFDKISYQHTNLCLHVCIFFMALLQLLWHIHYTFHTRFLRSHQTRFVCSNRLHCGSNGDLRKWLMANCFWNQQKSSGKYDLRINICAHTNTHTHAYTRIHTPSVVFWQLCDILALFGKFITNTHEYMRL